MRYFLELAYNGAAYRGWQRQPNAPSVQGTLEDVLSRLLGEQIEVTGAGRTDSGVHAAYYVAHFDAAREGDLHEGGVEKFLYHANAMLPPDIALRGVRPVANDAHARFDAREREYTYYITTRKDPFREGLAWYYSVPLDVDAMNMVAAKLLTVSDFTTFAKLGGGNRTNICHVTKAGWTRMAGGDLRSVAGAESSGVGQLGGAAAGGDGQQSDCLMFTIRADRFLRNMVRAIVGTLVDVGRGKLTVAEFEQAVDARNLSRASGGAPAHGLFLTDIRY